jgi:hypothetical protein
VWLATPVLHDKILVLYSFLIVQSQSVGLWAGRPPVDLWSDSHRAEAHSTPF